MFDLKSLLYKHGFSFNKSFGQNFLTDEELLDSIVKESGIDSNSCVLEIGCGAGTLTKVLAKTAKKVLGFEIDKRLKPVLEDNLSGLDNVDIIYDDIMKTELSKIEDALGENYFVVANLPYYITTPVITKFLESDSPVKSLSVMVQKEVAERLSAKPSSSDYGAITVAISLRGNAKIVKEVKKEMFTPMPKVDSAVVKIDIDRNKNKNVDFKSVRRLVKSAFNNRRKMFINNLMKDYNLKREELEKIFNELSIPLNARGENLSAEDFVVLNSKLK